MARRAQRSVVLALLLMAAFLSVGGVALWRSLGTLDAAMESENSLDYVPPTAIPSSLPPLSLRGVRVAVLDLPSNADMSAPGQYRRELGHWTAEVERLGATRVQGAQGADVLVVPNAPCLGVPERRTIADHLRRGGGVVTTGLLGERDGQCVPLQDTLLVTLLGGPRGSVAPFRPKGGADYYVTVLGETLFGAALPPGARFSMSPANQLVFRGADRAVYYSDYYRKPVQHGGERFYDGAVARARVGAGRVVAFGFNLDVVAPGWSRDGVRQIVGTAVQWAAGRPVAQLAPWPAGYRAAAVVAQDVEADFPNVAPALALLQRERMPGTFFVVGNLAERNPYITRDVARYGEVGSHTYDHRALDRFSDAEQHARLKLAMERTQRLSGRPVIGLRPPEERFTLATLQAWADLGGKYVFAANNSRAAGPEIVPVGPDSLVLLARVVDDDFELLSRDSVRDRGVMAQRLRDQLQNVVAYRGLYMFSYHSHMFAQESLLPVVESLVKALRATPQVWVTEARTVAQWWRGRSAVKLEVAPDGSTVKAVNQGKEPFRRGVLLLDLPDGRQERLRLPDLPPGRTATVRVPG